jgi:uncharacterized membrane protein (UPF0136 family)
LEGGVEQLRSITEKTRNETEYKEYVMNNLGQSRLASVVALLVGAWVAISPIWISVTGGALTSVIITGIVIAVAGLVQLFWKNAIPSWISGLAAVWLFISAFAFSNMGTSAMWSMVVSAIAVFILAFWDGMEVTQYNQHVSQHHAY